MKEFMGFSLILISVFLQQEFHQSLYKYPLHLGCEKALGCRGFGCCESRPLELNNVKRRFIR